MAHALNYPLIQADDVTYDLQALTAPELHELVIKWEADLASIDRQLEQENGRGEEWRRKTTTVRSFKLRQLGIITRELHRRQPSGGTFAEVFLATAREQLPKAQFHEIWEATCRLAPLPTS